MEPVSHASGSWDVIIVGGGPAGLSAALILGRCRRKVLVCDRGTPRSWASKAMHGFLTRDGIAPEEFRRLALDEIRRYPDVAVWRGEVSSAWRDEAGFQVRLGSELAHARKLLIATGVLDCLPPIEGFVEAFGISVFQCPYCDGWEVRDHPAAVYGKGRRGIEMSRALLSWTRDVVLCTDGAAKIGKADRHDLLANGIRMVEDRIARLVVDNGRLSHIEFTTGQRIPRDTLFFDTPSRGQSQLTQELGCRFSTHGAVLCGKYEATSVPGVYVAGNITRNVQLSIVAAAEGANAAFGINRALGREEYLRIATGQTQIEHTGPAL